MKFLHFLMSDLYYKYLPNANMIDAGLLCKVRVRVCCVCMHACMHGVYARSLYKYRTLAVAPYNQHGAKYE